MQLTIQSYKSVLESSEIDQESDHGKAKVEMQNSSLPPKPIEQKRNKYLKYLIIQGIRERIMSLSN